MARSGIDQDEKTVDIIRSALNADSRTLYEIGTLTGINATVLHLFASAKRGGMRPHAYMALVPVILPGWSYGLHQLGEEGQEQRS